MKTIFPLLGILPLAFAAPLTAQTQPSGPGNDLIDLYERMQREGIDETKLRQLLDEQLQKDLGDAMPRPENSPPPAAPGLRFQKPGEEAEMERRIWQELRGGMKVEDAPEEARPRAGEPMPPWLIGLVVEPIDPLIRSHLAIPEDTGVRISMVAPEGPAAKAGIRVNDILLSANGRPIRSLPELKEIVMLAGRERNAVVMELFQEGKRATVSVEPRGPQRPQAPGAEEREANVAPQQRRMDEMARQLERQQDEIRKLRQQIEELRARINRE
jgi:polyhydroxyalkanoate synthesis regulator phasin